jgi:hypothetical protein
MGCDLIGWMCIGPKEITDGQKDLAISRAARVVSLIKDWVENEEEPELPESLGHLVELDIDMSYQVEHFAEFSMDQIRSHVEEFTKFWTDPFCRDAVCRYYGDKQIVFAGAATWGDEPEGYGYQAIKDAMILDILEPLGIE